MPGAVAPKGDIVARTPSHARGIRILALVAVSVLLMLGPVAAPGKVQAQQPAAEVHLFTVVSARDEIVVGLSEAEVPALGGGNPLGVVATLLADGGRLEAWRYGPSRGEDGVVRHAPQSRVAIFAAGTVRIELYRTEQEVVPPPG